MRIELFLGEREERGKLVRGGSEFSANGISVASSITSSFPTSFILP